MTESISVHKDTRAEAQSSPFARFADTADRVAQTSKRLEKAKLLADYFTDLEDSDLVHAARYFAGHVFPLRDDRATNVGGAATFAAIRAISGANEDWLRQRLVARGDMGDVAEEAFAASASSAREPSLTMGIVASVLEGLASTSGSKRKIELVEDLLRPATPVEAKYLVKLAGGDLRIGLQEGAVEDAIARWSGNEVGRIQWVNMLTGDLGETAILAKRKRLDEAQMRLFHPLKFMLATPANDVADVARQMPEAFTVEDKFDGIRAQVHVAPDPVEGGTLHGVTVGGIRVALFSRTLDEITESFPDLIEPIARLVAATEPPGGPGLREVESVAFPASGMVESEQSAMQGYILDGEIVPVRGKQILPFLELQKRLGRKTLPQSLLQSVPVAFIAYDLLYSDGAVRLDEPFAERRSRLENLPVNGQAVRRADSRLFRDVTALDDEFDWARARGNEGLMVKDPRSTYKPGRRGRDWLKIKRAMATLDVVVTAVEVGNGRRSHLLSDYTFAVRVSEIDSSLLNVGKAYSGLTDAELAEMSEWFRAHTLQTFGHGKVRLVEPQVVIEVAFDRVQKSSRHKSGYALRFPRILRIRQDKPVSEIDTLEAVQRLVEESDGGNTSD